MVPEPSPVIEVAGRFPTPEKARAVAEALNRWFRWIVDGSVPPIPPLFEPFGVESSSWAWTLEEDVDWALGPHARAAGADVRIALQTHDTHTHLAGLLRALGAGAVKMARDADEAAG